MPNPGGRPTKLTPELQKRLCDAIAAGNYYEAACGYVGLTYATFRMWMKRGKRSRRGRFFEFFEAVRLAEAQAEVRAVAQWQKHMPENWQAIRDFLARRHPERWGAKDAVEVSGKKGAPIEAKVKHDVGDSLAPYAEVFRELMAGKLGPPRDASIPGDDSGQSVHSP